MYNCTQKMQKLKKKKMSNSVWHYIRRYLECIRDSVKNVVLVGSKCTILGFQGDIISTRRAVGCVVKVSARGLEGRRFDTRLH